MGFKGQPGPNAYKLPSTVGAHQHDPTRGKGPSYTIREKLEDKRGGLGPGLYRLSDTTRFGPNTAARITMGVKLQDLFTFKSPGPQYYRPEKVPHPKQNPPKITIGRRTEPPKPSYVPSANTYKLPSCLGPAVPDKPCNPAITIGKKHKTPRNEGVPAPNKYGLVNPDIYKTSAPKYTMRAKRGPVLNKTQKPAPNQYWPKLKHKEAKPNFTFGKRDSSSRMVMFTLEDMKP